MEVLVYLGILGLAVIGVPIFVIMALFALSAFTFAEIDAAAVVIEIYREYQCQYDAFFP